MSFQIIVDRDACQGHGQCVFAAADLFEIGDDGLVVVTVEQPAADRRAHAEQAADLCPMQAITIED